MLQIDAAHRQDDFTLEVRVEVALDGSVGLFGASGAGKSTLLDLIAGLRRPDRGRIALGDEVLCDAERGIDVPPERRRVGYVFQDHRLFPHLTVEGNLRYGWRRLPEAARRVAFDPVVELLGIGHLLGRRPRELSGGEKQRVAIGRALLFSPRLLLLDEPLASVDEARSDEILRYVERLPVELDIPLVYVSHDIDEVVRVCDALVVLDGGRVVASGEIESLLARPALAKHLGGIDAGAALSVTVEAHDREFGLTTLSFAGGALRVVAPADLAVGSTLRVRIRARDVALALQAPEQSSVLNVLAARVVSVSQEAAPQVTVELDVGGAALWARVTRKSAQDLGLRPGVEVYALVKSVALDRRSLGLRSSDGGRTRG